MVATISGNAHTANYYKNSINFKHMQNVLIINHYCHINRFLRNIWILIEYPVLVLIIIQLYSTIIHDYQPLTNNQLTNRFTHHYMGSYSIWLVYGLLVCSY